jgi:hypothetical protein
MRWNEATGGGVEGEGCLSNRKATCAVSALGGLGVDRLSLSFPVSDFEPDPSAWGEVTYVSPGTVAAAERRKASVNGPGGIPVFVGLQEIPEHPTQRWWGKVEFNPSRLADPEGWELVGADRVAKLVGQAERRARDLLAPREPRADWRVKRVDVARDFDRVGDGSGLIRALAPVPRPWCRRNFVHSDPRRHGAQTLSAGSGAGMCRLYDKAAETVGKAPEGTLRWEAECRDRWSAKYGGIVRVRDIKPAAVERLARDRWEWSSMGVEVATSAGQLVQHVRGSGLTAREQTMFIGWLFQQAAGDAWRPASGHTLAKFRRVQRDLGIAMPADFGEAGGVLRRLDFDSGQEVIRVA